MAAIILMMESVLCLSITLHQLVPHPAGTWLGKKHMYLWIPVLRLVHHFVDSHAGLLGLVWAFWATPMCTFTTSLSGGI
jgi:hypothetical protein